MLEHCTRVWSRGGKGESSPLEIFAAEDRSI